MVEIYCGDGKGKTTAAVGLALRAAGNGVRVLFIQFMKDGSSGEIKMLESMAGVSVYYPEKFYGFVRNMNSRQKEEMRRQYTALLKLAGDEALKQKNADNAINNNVIDNNVIDNNNIEEIRLVAVLDEVIYACNKGLLEEAALLKLLDECPGNTEMILTGREPSDALIKRADYISEVAKVRHPFDRGVPARRGIEL